MGLTGSWPDRVAHDRRRRRRRILLVDETSLGRGHRYVTVIINGDTGETLGIVAHRNTAALSGFWWLKATAGSKGSRWWSPTGPAPTGQPFNSISAMPLMFSTGSTSPDGSLRG